ncbi:flagellar biosynthetic protein FliR [Clostridiales bacterium]|nr:flagellar biosynthetic protein FliR [Clostridiales bacterium]
MQIAGTQEFMLFSLVLMRMSGFIFLNPILGRRNFPAMAKTGMALALAILIYPLSGGEISDIGTPIEYGVLLMKEFLIGYLLGFIMQLFAFVVTYAGSIIDFHMALGMASVFDAQNGVQVALTGNILNMYFLLLFFAVDGHLALMDILVNSAEIVPYAQISFGADAALAVLNVFYDCVLLAVKMAFPVIGIVLVLDVGVGILMKIIPQINVFILDIPLKIILGFVMLIFLLAPFSNFLGNLITDMLKAAQHSLTTV